MKYKDDAPDDKELLRLSYNIARKWNQVGILLGLPRNTINYIEKNSKDKAYDMLLDWRNTTTSLSHHKDLYNALCDEIVGLNNVAKTFCLE